MKLKVSLAILLSFLMVAFPTMLSYRWGTAVGGQDSVEAGDVQSQIDVLLAEYDVALQNELAHGTVQEVSDPTTGTTRILTGESQAKMDRLWAETLQKIEALQARSDEERAPAMAKINELSGIVPTYVGRSRIAYSPGAEIEDYEANGLKYQVDIQSGQIIKIWIINQTDYDRVAKYTKSDLLDLARNYVSKVSPELVLDRLILAVQTKGPDVVFLRWEDHAGQLPDGTAPFVQVALSRSGDFLNYENTLPFAAPATGSVFDQLFAVTPALAIGANEVYSNGGTRWSWEVLRNGATYTTQSNAGYCYTQGSWCTPKNFYYATAPSGNNTYEGSNHRGKWASTSAMRNLNTRTSAYIPCTHATAVVFYFNWYNGGSSVDESGINQTIWCNTWVASSSKTLYNIYRVVLANTDETCCNHQIAWDEIWDYVP